MLEGAVNFIRESANFIAISAALAESKPSLPSLSLISLYRKSTKLDGKAVSVILNSVLQSGPIKPRPCRQKRVAISSSNCRSRKLLSGELKPEVKLPDGTAISVSLAFLSLSKSTSVHLVVTQSMTGFPLSSSLDAKKRTHEQV